MKQVIQIRCKNNKKTQKVEIGSTLFDVFSSFDLKMTHGPVSARVNNKVEGMHYRVYNSKDVEFLDMTTASGSRAYTRTLFFVLCKAVQDIYPATDVVIDIPVSNGFYVDIRLGRPRRILGRVALKVIARAVPAVRHRVVDGNHLVSVRHFALLETLLVAGLFIRQPLLAPGQLVPQAEHVPQRRFQAMQHFGQAGQQSGHGRLNRQPLVKIGQAAAQRLEPA